MTQISSSHHTMGCSSFLCRLITTTNWFNSFKMRRKIKRFTKPVDVMDKKLLLFHLLISQWKIHLTFSVLEISKMKKMLRLQKQARVDDKCILPKEKSFFFKKKKKRGRNLYYCIRLDIELICNKSICKGQPCDRVKER